MPKRRSKSYAILDGDFSFSGFVDFFFRFLDEIFSLLRIEFFEFLKETTRQLTQFISRETFFDLMKIHGNLKIV